MKSARNIIEYRIKIQTKKNRQKSAENDSSVGFKMALR